MPHILVIGNDRRAVRDLERGLRAHGYEVETGSSVLVACERRTSPSYDCLVVDLRTAGYEELEALWRQRASGWGQPVLVLAQANSFVEAAFSEETVVRDSLTGPFELNELLTRLELLLRSDRPPQRRALQSDNSLMVDAVRRRVAFGDHSVVLTRREFDVFAYLLRHRNRPVSRAMLSQDIWEETDYSLTNVIEVYINILRRKLETAGLPRLIHTVRGVGYTLRVEALALESVR